jgi:NIMA (never in mitosis gene a)-related kinase
VLEQLNHPNIIRFHEVYKTKHRKLCIVMEYADGGDLAGKIEAQRGVPMDENTILSIFVQTCLAIKHMHDRKVLHRDLKTQNVFLTASSMVKLGDFGIAKVLSATADRAKTFVGTPYYLSPEIVRGLPYGFKSDIWALGVVLYEMCALKPPFRAQSMQGLAERIVQANFPQLSEQYSPELRALVGRLLSREPENRPTIYDILWTPIVQHRIGDLLSNSLRQREFSHTILHGQALFSAPKAHSGPANQQIPPVMTVEALTAAKQEEAKRVEMLEEVKRQQLVHTLSRDQAAALAGNLVRDLPESERQQEEAKVLTDLDSQAQIIELEIALLQHPSEARLIDMPEPTTPRPDRDDDIGETSPFARTSGMGKVEAMRSLLEGQLGETVFLQAYRVIKHIEDTMGPDSWDISLLYEKLSDIMRPEEVEQTVPKIQVLLDLERQSNSN